MRAAPSPRRKRRYSKPGNLEAFLTAASRSSTWLTSGIPFFCSATWALRASAAALRQQPFAKVLCICLAMLRIIIILLKGHLFWRRLKFMQMPYIVHSCKQIRLTTHPKLRASCTHKLSMASFHTLVPTCMLCQTRNVNGGQVFLGGLSAPVQVGYTCPQMLFSTIKAQSIPAK